jgi:peptidoglycan/LPS O-acetylase OafA/YrhL
VTHCVVAPALSGVRFFAAFHIFLLHVVSIHRIGLLRFTFLEEGPWWVVNLWAAGHVSTSFFFVLSGFILTYVYSEPRGGLRVAASSFWIARFSRLYPLSIIALVLCLPIMVLGGRDPVELLVGVLLGVGLLQAWVPFPQLWLNVPCWVLSALLLFYVLFPGLLRALARLGRQERLLGLVGLWLLKVGLCLLYMRVDPDGVGPGGATSESTGVWLQVLKFNPVVWLPEFTAGVLAAGWWMGTPEGAGAPSLLRRWGAELMLLALGAVCILSPPRYYVLLRHGLLLPLHVAMVLLLASGKGPLTAFLGHPVYRYLGENASLGIFMFQAPVFFVFLAMSMAAGGGPGGLPRLVALLVSVPLVALVSTYVLERPLSSRVRQWLQRRWQGPTAPAVGQG